MMANNYVQHIAESNSKTKNCHNLSPNKKPADVLVSRTASTVNLTISKLSKAKDSLRSFFHKEAETETKSISSQPSDENNLFKNATVREKLNNAWLSFKYGNWHLKSHINFRENEQLCLLGSFYSRPNDDTGLQEFLFDYYSRIWLTYRTGLPSLPGTLKTSDCGWGCMLRSCQMMIAETLVLLHLGRKWRFSKQQVYGAAGSKGTSYAEILSLFGDDIEAGLGLHRVMEIAQGKYKKPVDSWYSPCEALWLFREALEQSDSGVTAGLKLFYINDGLLVKSELSAASNEFKTPLLLIFCIRLGTTKINMCYRDQILNLLNVRNTVGMLGGRPKHSLYFIGSYDRKYLIYMDPHVVHKAIPSVFQPKYWQVFHCTDILKMQLDTIDPSCAFGFLLKSEEDFEVFLSDLQNCRVLDGNTVPEGGQGFKGTLISVVPERPVFSLSCVNSFPDTLGDQDFEVLQLITPINEDPLV